MSSVPVYFLSFFKAPSEEKDSLWCKVLQAKYEQEGGRLRFGEGVGSHWWRSMNDVRRSFGRLFDLAVDKNVSVADMFAAGWDLGGEAWKWRRRLNAWEEELVVECVARLANVVLQVGARDRWVWRLDSSQCYSVKSAYSFLTASDVNITASFVRFIWLKVVPLKVTIFIWRLFLNRLPTKANLRHRRIIEDTQTLCPSLCGKVEDSNHLFFQCEVYGRIWHLIIKWLGVESALHGDIDMHSVQFSGLGEFSPGSRQALSIIWSSVLYTIWCDRNCRIFSNESDSMEALVEKVKLQTFWWMKSCYALFDVDYATWRLRPWSTFQAIS
ncbi:hypothetical protein TSUD_281010 [Trifolium subterraneum]|uniref:Reverse transcriptase zinc-binding domain-containing protein n=1 Tax=Trifolium subterraneum TaxID=3900 RepID=A0A2Z6NZK3_TRISU|nr:hypothetical protein TSUD_281010 [Trifolium subterraneum]